jgi:hypothetical protein
MRSAQESYRDCPQSTSLTDSADRRSHLALRSNDGIAARGYAVLPRGTHREHAHL